MPNGENNDSFLMDDLLDSLVENIHDSEQEWTEKELREFKQQLEEWAKRLKWAKDFLIDHPHEVCVDERLSSECKKIEIVHKEVMSFLYRIKNKVKNLELQNVEEALNEGVYEIISAYYPNTSWEFFLSEVENAKAKRRETILDKASKIVIAEVSILTFQEAIKECCKNNIHIECLCLLVQTLLDYGINYKAIGRIIDKKEATTRKFMQRCKKHLREHEKRYLQTIENQE